MNSINIIATLTRDPELRATTQGASVCTLSIAHNERRSDSEHVSYFDVDTFGKTADNCALYLHKGREVAISGRLRQERWEKDGQKHSRVKIVANNVQFIGKGKRTVEQVAVDSLDAVVVEGADEIPF